MTTNNTHYEHNDVDASLIEHQSVPENTDTPSTSETITSEGIETQVDIPASDEPATSDASQIEVPQETPIVSDASTIQVEEQHVTPGQEDQPQNWQRSEGTSDSEVTPDDSNSTAPGEAVTVFNSDETSQQQTKEEEIRPFTDFIEEFRQSEARLGTSQQEVQTEPFESLSAEDVPFITEAGIVSDELVLPTTSDEIAPIEPAAESTEFHSEEDTTLPAQQPLVEESSKETPIVRTVLERAVSPLLRPATRLRVPRHGGRHIREDAVTEKGESSATPPTTPITSEISEASVATPQPEQNATTEVSGEPEQPRPARRYRFDRPTNTTTVSTGSTGASHVQSPATAPEQAEENKEKDAQNHEAQASTEKVHIGNNQQTEVVGAATQLDSSNVKTGSTSAASPSVEQPAQKQVQETSPTESTHAPSTSEHGRRRQGQERQKEQPGVASTTNAISSTEPGVQSGEVAPEDLPPLEYAELQKASTRRRRRHRPGTSSNGSTAATATEVAIATVQQPVQPAATTPVVTPILPAASALPIAPRPIPTAANGTDNNGNQYTIVSGYTVSQMNQGNEIAGPFMGPEPSPARGSVVTRDGRTARAESQRSPIYPPVRTHEAGPSSASMNHFASSISQAIQTQTDRMVAELRRNSQAPTNVSVSLPPFPSTERVGVFVDVANLLYSARTLRIPVDFGKLLDFLRGNRRLIRAHAYCPTSPQAGDEQMFLQAVKGLGYRITTKNYKTFSSGAKKADLDLDLCMDVVRIVDGRAVDCIVLVSGDSDFMPMLDYCSDHGVRVEVAAFDEAMSATLRQSCDLFINLSMLEEIRS